MSQHHGVNSNRRNHDRPLSKLSTILSWNPSYLFVATLEGFFFDEINNIIENKGAIVALQDPQLNDNLQNRYLDILKDFERNN